MPDTWINTARDGRSIKEVFDGRAGDICIDPGRETDIHKGQVPVYIRL